MALTMYDLMAWICMFLTQMPHEEQMYLYRLYQSNVQDQTDAIESIFEFFRRKNAMGPIRYDSLSKEQIQKVLDKIMQWKNSVNDKKNLLFLLSYLDSYIDFDSSFEAFLKRDAEETTMNVFGFCSLNGNFDQTKGQLIPRLNPC